MLSVILSFFLYFFYTPAQEKAQPPFSLPKEDRFTYACKVDLVPDYTFSKVYHLDFGTSDQEITTDRNIGNLYPELFAPVYLKTKAGSQAQIFTKAEPENLYYQHSKLALALRKTAEMQKAAEMRVGEFYKKRYCIDNNMVSSYSKEQTAAYVAHFGAKTKELGSLTEELNTLIKSGPNKTNLEKVNQYQSKLKKLIARLDNGFNDICATERTLCGCYSG